MSALYEDALTVSLQEIVKATSDFHDDWWIFGSAAAHLAGARVGHVHDIDLLLGEADARRLLDCWPAPATSGGATEQFRSRVFARFHHLPMPVEIMAGFAMKVAGAWRAIKPKTRVRRGDVYTPSVAEQIELLELMNRPKDQPRIAALSAISARKRPLSRDM